MRIVRHRPFRIGTGLLLVGAIFAAAWLLLGTKRVHDKPSPPNDPLHRVLFEGSKAWCFDPTDETLQAIADRDVTLAALYDPIVSPAGILMLRQCPNLHTLFIHSKSLTDEHVNAVGQLKSLVNLTLDCDTLTDESLSALAQLEMMGSLDLDGVNLSDECVSRLVGMSSLRRLVVRSTKITNAINENRRVLATVRYFVWQTMPNGLEHIEH